MDWQKIIMGNDGLYQKKILDAGFDGAYLDIIDVFEYFEKESARRLVKFAFLLASLRQIWLNFVPRAAKF